ncbi:MAG: hypothetical protein JOZ17_25480 [Acetobacteraceae bacterium]|nr:hypothetical protein [Acetobacteraceae bacterium]
MTFPFPRWYCLTIVLVRARHARGHPWPFTLVCDTAQMERLRQASRFADAAAAAGVSLVLLLGPQRQAVIQTVPVSTASLPAVSAPVQPAAQPAAPEHVFPCHHR